MLFQVTWQLHEGFNHDVIRHFAEMTPVLAEKDDIQVGSLEYRLRCRARQLMSNLAKLSKRKSEILLYNKTRPEWYLIKK